MPAYAFQVSAPLSECVDGRWHVTWTIDETDLARSSEWTVPLPTMFCTITLFEVQLVDGGGGLGQTGATTVDPHLGVATGWTPDTLDEVCQNAVPASFLRNSDDQRVTATGRALYGRSRPNAPAAQVRTRLTIVLGHQP